MSNYFDQDDFYDQAPFDWEDCDRCDGDQSVNPSDGVCQDCGFDHAEAWLSGPVEDAAMEAGLYGWDA
jgi:hypothetical protein